MDEDKLRELVREEVHNSFIMVNQVLQAATTGGQTKGDLVSLVPEQAEEKTKPTHRPTKPKKAKEKPQAAAGPSREDLVSALGKLGGAAKVKKVLGEFNAAKVSELDPAQYADVIEVAKAAAAPSEG